MGGNGAELGGRPGERGERGNRADERADDKDKDKTDDRAFDGSIDKRKRGVIISIVMKNKAAEIAGLQKTGAVERWLVERTAPMAFV